jgi:MYXO-CTERM domain-containing protein
VELAQVVTPPPSEAQIAARDAQTINRTLPTTASPLPLIALFGLLALGGAFTLRFVEKRAL